MAEKFSLTKKAVKDYQDELDHLIQVDRPNIITKLADARAQGDLSENADYDAARGEQARIESRIKELQYILKNYTIIDGKASSNNMGKKVTFLYPDLNKTLTFTIVGSLEADPRKNTISDESPLGKAALSAKVGEEFTVTSVNAEYRVKVLNIE